MLALNQYQGVWLYGEQGVGKTETIKELAWTLGKRVRSSRGAISSKFPSKRDLEDGSNSLYQIVEGVCRDLRLEPCQLFVRKIQELFDALNARNGVVLLTKQLWSVQL
jgi:hypothetical protein